MALSAIAAITTASQNSRTESTLNVFFILNSFFPHLFFHRRVVDISYKPV